MDKRDIAAGHNSDDVLAGGYVVFIEVYLLAESAVLWLCIPHEEYLASEVKHVVVQVIRGVASKGTAQCKISVVGVRH